MTHSFKVFAKADCIARCLILHTLPMRLKTSDERYGPILFVDITFNIVTNYPSPKCNRKNTSIM